MSFLFQKEQERLLYTTIHEKTVQLANYLVKLSFSDYMKEDGKKPDADSEMNFYRLTLLLYFTEGLSFMEYDESLIKEESFLYGGNVFPGATIELPSLQLTWGKFSKQKSLVDKLLHMHQFSVNLSMDEFMKECLPVDRLTEREKGLLESIWIEFQDLSTKQMAESVVESVPYVRAKERFEQSERGETVCLEKQDIREDFLSLKHTKE